MSSEQCVRDAERDVALPTSSGVLHGTLRMPVGCTSAPIVLIIAGSGPIDRDGNATLGLHTDTYRQLADALAQRGVGSLRYDKRGIGASARAAPREDDVRLETFVDDAIAWLAWLRQLRRASALVLFGHSEGALIAMLAAQRSPVAALISVATPARKLGDVLRMQLEARLSGELRKRAEAIVTQLEQQRPVPDVPQPLMALFRPSAQPFMRSLLSYNPAVELGKLRLPTLIVHGTSDLQVPVSEARTLHELQPDSTLLIVQGMTHTLKLDHGEADQRRAYKDASEPLAPALLAGLDSFVGPIIAALRRDASPDQQSVE